MAFHRLIVLPSPSPNKVSTLKFGFRSSILGPWFPLSTLNSTPYDAKPMTRGLGVVLTLPIRGLTSGAAAAPIFYRFISAHWVAYLSSCQVVQLGEAVLLKNPVEPCLIYKIKVSRVRVNFSY